MSDWVRFGVFDVVMPLLAAIVMVKIRIMRGYVFVGREGE